MKIGIIAIIILLLNFIFATSQITITSTQWNIISVTNVSPCICDGISTSTECTHVCQNVSLPVPYSGISSRHNNVYYKSVTWQMPCSDIDASTSINTDATACPCSEEYAEMSISIHTFVNSDAFYISSFVIGNTEDNYTIFPESVGDINIFVHMKFRKYFSITLDMLPSGYNSDGKIFFGNSTFTCEQSK